ncbi:acetylxylan esterase [Akkermansiaceae bacterium]|nr:acetylxylan esterase [Akkermansiaceae bacterium]
MVKKTYPSRKPARIAIPAFLALLSALAIAAEPPVKPWEARADVVEALAKRLPGTNFEESKVPEYRLPDPLVSENGKPVRTPLQWTDERRPEILQLFRENVYGIRPATPYRIAYEEVGRRENAFAIGATARQIRATLTARGKSHSFDFVLVVPKSDAPVPVIIHINNRYLIPLGKAVDEADPFWPVEKIVRRGYATAAFHTSDIDPDKRDGYAKGIRALLDDPSSDPETRWAALSAWAWGASRVLDFATKQPGIDPRRSAVAGNSRAGKTALWAGAEDTRFQIAYSNESGCGGAALSRRAFGETVARITDVIPYWFCPRFKRYAGRESDLPIDQHQLIALMAPRAVYVASADEDLWADPKGEYASLLAAGPVFGLHGLRYIADPEMPPLNTPRHVGSTGYHIRTGVHNLTEQDWGYFLDFADRVFGK